MIWLGITGGAVLLLALATFFFLWRWTVQKKRLAESQIKQLEQEKQLIATQAVLDGEVQERTRLARDLHDGLGSILAAAKYNLIDIRKTLVMNEAEAERFDSSISLLNDSMHEMRRVAHHLMPESLGSAGLKQSIADFCNSVPIVKFSYYGDDTRLNPNLEVIISVSCTNW
jgi:signal transduction histidine kinase